MTGTDFYVALDAWLLVGDNARYLNHMRRDMTTVSDTYLVVTHVLSSNARVVTH